jgi:hypothetical protein
MLTVILQANVCISMATSEMVSASVLAEVKFTLSYCPVVQIKSLLIQYVVNGMTCYTIQSSSSAEQPDNTVCRSQCGVL